MLISPGRLIAVGAAFALGGLPVARVVSSRSGVRIERVGTGNPGAANVMRSIGRSAGALVLAGDAAKGALPVLAGRALGADDDLLGALAIAPVAGHVVLTGGRGVGAALGAAGAGDPAALAMVAPIFLGGTLLRVHAASVLATYVALPLVRLVLGRPRRSVCWTAALMAFLTGTRLRGAVRDRRLDRGALWERLLHDRGPAPAGER